MEIEIGDEVACTCSGCQELMSPVQGMVAGFKEEYGTRFVLLTECDVRIMLEFCKIVRKRRSCPMKI